MNEELEEIKMRLLALEADQAAQKDAAAAHFALLLSAVRVLYRRDPTALREWIAETRSSSAFGLAAHDKKPPELLEPLLGALQDLQDALSKFGPPPLPQQGSTPP